MTQFIISTIVSYSIFAAALIGLVRWKHIIPSYRPFVIICMAATTNEIFTTISVLIFHTNAVNVNIYMLAESMLYMWLFREWGAITEKSYRLRCLLLAGLWTVDNFFINTILTINSLFMVVYFFSLIFLAIGEINKLILSGRDAVLRDSRSLICIGIVIFYTYAVTTETFYLLKLNFSNQFYNQVHLVLEAVNLIVNTIFAIAVLWIPRRQKFILPF